MRFNEYITEKITKKQYKEALKNDNINAGCEFEFYIDDDKRALSSLIDYEHINKLINHSDEEIKEYNDNLTGYFNAIDEMRDKEEEYQEKEDKLTEEIEETGQKIEELDNKIKELTQDLENADTDKEKIKDEINYRENLKDEEYDILDDLKTDLKNYEEELRRIYDGEAFEEIEQEYEPYPHVSKFPTFFNYLIPELEDVVDLRTENDHFYNQELFDIFDKDQEMLDTEDLFYHIFAIRINDLENDSEQNIPAEEEIEQLKFPYDLSDFSVIEDSSLGSNGVEIVTSTEELPDLVTIIKNVFEWIEDIGYTDDSCGFHVHMSMDAPYKLDPLKLILFTEEGRIYKDFEDRMFNRYAINIKQGHFDSRSPFTIEHIKEFTEKSSITKSLNFDKFIGVHLVDLKNNHVEFRYMGGKNYHNKYKEVEEVIANYAYWLSIACDPDYKKKEYIKKLNRMVNYYNALYLYNLLQFFRNDAQEFFDTYKRYDKVPEKILIKIFEKISKPYMKSLKALPTFDNYTIKNNNLKDSIIKNSYYLVDEFKEEVLNYIKKKKR